MANDPINNNKIGSDKALTLENKPKSEIYDVSTLYNGINQPINEPKQSLNYQPLGFTSIAITIQLRSRLITLKEQLKMKSWTDLLNYLLDYCEELENKLEEYEHHGSLG